MISEHRFKKMLKGYKRAGLQGMAQAVGVKPVRTAVGKPVARRNVDNRAGQTPVQSNRKIGLFRSK